MGNYIQANRDDSNVALTLSVGTAAGGGIAGLTVVVAIRDASAAQTPLPLYLDFADSTFKTAGWATRQAAMVDNGGGIYALDGGLDPSAFTNLPATTVQLAAEYEITAGSPLGVDNDLIDLDRLVTQCHLGVTYDGVGTVSVDTWLERRGRIVTPTSSTVTIFDDTGAAVAGPTTSLVADAQDHIVFTLALALVANTNYYYRVTMIDALGTITTDRAVPFTA